MLTTVVHCCSGEAWVMLETSVDLRSSQAWSQFDDAMTQFGGHGGAESPVDTAGDDHHPSAVNSDDELSDAGGFHGLVR